MKAMENVVYILLGARQQQNWIGNKIGSKLFIIIFGENGFALLYMFYYCLIEGCVGCRADRL